MEKVLVMVLLLQAVHSLPQGLRSERDALIFQYALKGVYTAAEIAVILATAHGFYLR